MRQSSRILINTIAQYIRILIVILVMMYSTRIVLNQLGNCSFGLYSLVGSTLAFLAFLNTTLTRSIQRFLSFYMGKEDEQLQKQVLFNSVLLNLLITFVTIVVMMSIAPVLFTKILCIPEQQLMVAKVLYVLMAISVLFTINVAPFNAIFVSHENIVFSSIVYVFLAILRLAAALSLQYFASNKLLIYGIFMCLISIVELIIYIIFAKIKYTECNRFLRTSNYNPKLLKEILFFAGWNLYGTICILVRSQGYAVVINKYISLIANASYGIAMQVAGQINNLVYSLSNAVSPVIMKSKGAADDGKMKFYSIESSKIAFLLFTIIVIPIIVEIRPILQLWLGEVPEYTTSFVVSILIASLADCISVGFRTGIQAIGNLKKYSLIVYSIKIMVIPISIWMLIAKYETSLIFVPYIVAEIVGSIITIIMFCNVTRTSIWKLMTSLAKNIVPSLSTSIIVCLFIINIMQPALSRVLLTLAASAISTIVVAYYTAINNEERKFIWSLIKKIE